MEITIAQEHNTRSSAPKGSQKKKHRKKKKKGVNPILIVLIVALVIAIAVFAGIGVYAMRYSNYDKILPNVYVAGIDVGGMTVEEASDAIEASVAVTEQKSVNVNLPDQVLTFTPQQDTVLIDVDQAVAEAYNYGRNSDNPFAMSRAIKAAQRRRNDIDISTALTVDTDYIHDLIDSTAEAVAADLVESDVQADTDARTIDVTIGTPGRELDTESLYNLVYNAFTNGDYSDIDFEYTMTYPATVALDRLYEQMTTEPEDAYYDPDSGEIVDEVYGYTPSTPLVDANEQLALATAGDELSFTFDETAPEMTKAALAPMLFRDVLYSYGTTYANNSNRTQNLKLACQAINGTVLQPGEIFSFNDVVGERTKEKGYRDAVVYVNGNSEEALGGGICQVASTIYYCCMYSDLEVVHREEHMYFVTYITPGLDATVYWGSVDFQFRNSTDYPLRIDANVSNGKVNIKLVGTDVNNYTIKVTNQKVSTTPFDKLVKDGTGENVSGYTGYVYVITRYVYDSAGNLIRTDTTEDLDNMGGGLGTSTYQKRDQITYNGRNPGGSGGTGGGGGGGGTTPTPTPPPTTGPTPTPPPTTTPTPTPPPVDPPVDPPVVDPVIDG